METITKAKEIIKKGLALLPDEAKGEWKASASDEMFIDDAIEAASKALDGELKREKEAMLKAYSIQEANRMASTLWRLKLLPEDLEKEYRALPSMTEAAATYNAFLDARKARSEELNQQGRKLQEEQRTLDIFMGIVNGVPAEDSERRYDEFKNAQQQALAGGR